MDDDYLDYHVVDLPFGSDDIIRVHLKSPNKLDDHIVYGYFIDGKPRILPTFHGEEKGATIFNDVLIVSGHDGNHLWNIKTGEYLSDFW